MKRLSLLPILFILIQFIIGCTQPKQVQKTEPAPTETEEPKPFIPEMVIKIGSLNLSNFSRKIELNDIENLKNVVEQDSINILAIQGITRYPDLKTRIDFIDEFSKQSNMRKAFGENINNSGRQTGNVVFSEYPILFNDNTYFENIKSTKFEAMLHAQIDCGIRSVVIFNTLLPEKASIEEQTSCIKTISVLRKMYDEYPVIILGNLPTSNTLRMLGNFDEAAGFSDKNRLENSNHIWFNGTAVLRSLEIRSVVTKLGNLTIVKFVLMQTPKL